MATGSHVHRGWGPLGLMSRGPCEAWVMQLLGGSLASASGQSHPARQGWTQREPLAQGPGRCQAAPAQGTCCCDGWPGWVLAY